MGSEFVMMLVRVLGTGTVEDFHLLQARTGSGVKIVSGRATGTKLNESNIRWPVQLRSSVDMVEQVFLWTHACELLGLTKLRFPRPSHLVLLPSTLQLCHAVT